MAIHKLPEYLINRLKAWEIVERPSSIVKELVENSLDAWATKIVININDGWKNLISIEDNGSWIQLSDMDLLFERYATSKINWEQDLLSLQTYGFRGEALASISEVSKTTVISKTAYAEIWSKISKIGRDLNIQHQPVGFEHGTIIQVEDLFFNVPARLKFLKSSQTEFFYCYNHFIDIAIFHYDKHLVLKKNDKILYDLLPTDGIIERINEINRKDLEKNLIPFSYQDDHFEILWILSDTEMRFGSAENIRIYVDSRPVQDKIIKKALMDAYHRQITPGEYPLAVIMIKSKPWNVDVNVHPRKLEVKFLDPWKIFNIIYETVKSTLGWNKITTTSFSQNYQHNNNNYTSNNQNYQQNNQNSNQLFSQESNNLYVQSDFQNIDNNLPENQNPMIWNYKLIWQLRNSYIVVEAEDWLYYIDQHALAERISFEKMKKEIADKIRLKPENLLQPITQEVNKIQNIEEKINQINELWFDCSLLGENKIVVYAIPQIFSIYKIDLEKLFNIILYLEEINFDIILDKIFASKACKTSVKAGDKLSLQEMQHLVSQGFEIIPWLFVCQHGRPFFIKIEKKDIDKSFDR